jgi:hypothetical protein
MTVTRTIGVGGNHADINLWVSYVQSNVVTAGALTDNVVGAITIGGCSVSVQQVVSGWTPGGSGFTTTLTADTGASFKNNANVRTNALYYNSANGAFFTSSLNATSGAINFQVNKFRVQGLQILVSGGYTRAISTTTATINDLLIEGNIIDASSDDGTIIWHSGVDGANIIVRNNVIWNLRGASASNCINYNAGCQINPAQLYDNTFWANNLCVNAGSYGLTTSIGNAFIGLLAGTGNPIQGRSANTTGSNNATSQSAWFSIYGNLTGLTASQLNIVVANEFVGGATPTDFRLKSGGTQCQGTNIPVSGITTDISGVTRTNPTDIGAWQFAAGSTAVTGNAAWTEAQDSWNASGSVLVAGTVAWTELKDSWNATGSVVVAGTAAWTELPDGWAVSGSISAGAVTAAAAWTEIPDGWNIQAAIVGTGSVAWTEPRDSWAISGAIVGTGAIAWNETQDSWNVSAALLVAGGIAWTEPRDSWAVVGSLTLPAITGTVAWSEAQDSWAIRLVPGAIALPPFNFDQAWSLLPPGLIGTTISLVAYQPITEQFLVLHRDGNYALWLNMPQSVMFAIQLSPDPTAFLHNLGQPNKSTFTP